MVRGRLLGGCLWLLGALALLQMLYLRALPPPRAPPAAPRPRRPPRGVLDASGSFRVYRDVLGPPPAWASAPRPELVLATHGSPGRAAAALGGPWGGPLSVAVFGVPREGLEELMAILGGPCRALRGRLRLHVVLGAAGPPPRPPNPPRAPQNPPKSPQNPAGGCRAALERLAAADPPSYSLGVPYPGNLLRNVAWEGAAGGGRGRGAPPGFGGRWVLLVDADVVPSPGLHQGFLELLRDGGLHPKTWGDGGGLGEHRDGGAQGDLGAQRDFRDPKALGAPSALKVPNTLGVPSVPGGPDGREHPKALEDPKALQDLGVQGVPRRSGVADASSRDLGVPNALETPKLPEDPKAPELPGGLQSLSVPNALQTPNIPEPPEALRDPEGSEPPWARTLFVLPAFEVRGGLRPPATKAELLRLWGAGDARPFYGTLCPRCQAPTAFGRWRGLPQPPRLRVAYEVPWRDPWEPFFVAPARGVPPFDERFLQYGFNRISQACELHVAGFRFAVLDGAFVTHRGFKEPWGFHGAREAELGHNRELFRAFRAELGQRYPGSPRHC